MEPRIQYAKTEDGVNIAFWTVGEGMPFVHMFPLGLSHAELERQIPELRLWYERLAENRKLVRYDNRGVGLSDRDVTDLSLRAHLLDLEAVVDRLGLERFVLFAVLDLGPVAVAYAVRHPERLSHLILWCTFAQASDYYASSPQLQALHTLTDQNWEVFTETAAQMGFGWSEGEVAHRLAAFMRECTTADTFRAAVEAMRGFDVTAMLPKVRVPTLVMHRRQVRYPVVDLGRQLAARIPDAHLLVLEGTSIAPWDGIELNLASIDGFLGEDAGSAKEFSLPEGTAIILFADIADSTALTEELGDTAFRSKATGLDGLLRKLIRDAGGTPVEGKVLGDGVMAVFTSARQAIDCALRCKQAGDEGGLPLHLGIHAGDVIREGNTVYGGAVNLAQRVADACPAGEVFVSDTVRSLARTSTEVGFEDRGEHGLKGIPEPQRLFAVRTEGSPQETGG